MTYLKPDRLSRRKFLKLSGTASLGLVLSACGLTPTSLVTPAPITTPTLTSTLSPTITPRPTATLTPTITSTPTSKPTSAPTPTETPKIAVIGITMGKVIFQDDFDSGKIVVNRSGSPKWNNVHNNGGTVTVEEAKNVLPQTEWSDSQGNSRGKVMVARLGDAIPSDYGPGLWNILYPDFFRYGADGNIYYVKGSAGGGVSVDFWKNDNTTGGGNILGLHRQNMRTMKIDSVVAINMRNDILRVTVRDTKGRDTDFPMVSTLFNPKTMNNVMLVIDSEGKVLPFVNGKFAMTSRAGVPRVPVNAEYPGSFTDSHAGFLHGSASGRDNGPGGIVVNDNYKVFEVEDISMLH